MEIVYEQCCYENCGHSPFPMVKSYRDRCLKTHEWFHCPSGHKMHFSGPSEEEKLRKKVAHLESRLSSADWKIERLQWQVHKCPWVGCEFEAHPANDYDMRAMWSHLRSAHGMPTKSEVLAAEKEELNLPQPS